VRPVFLLTFKLLLCGEDFLFTIPWVWTFPRGFGTWVACYARITAACSLPLPPVPLLHCAVTCACCLRAGRTVLPHTYTPLPSAGRRATCAWHFPLLPAGCGLAVGHLWTDSQGAILRCSTACWALLCPPSPPPRPSPMPSWCDRGLVLVGALRDLLRALFPGAAYARCRFYPVFFSLRTNLRTGSGLVCAVTGDSTLSGLMPLPAPIT